ncbi:hypothetical protein AB0F18_13225 [Streptomyces sp. NPDC029216]|uniref:hypothetical protein n=1 Tax=Streptomyces sp. NPDC029216 TaxID=3154701 RepID=UPI0033FD7AD4
MAMCTLWPLCTGRGSAREAPLAGIADDDLIREVAELRASVEEPACLVASQPVDRLRIVDDGAV